jgi:hypothetical protein
MVGSMISGRHSRSEERRFWLAFPALICAVMISSHAVADETVSDASNEKGERKELSWEMPGRVSIYDLQFGPAIFRDNQWHFQGNSRTFNAGAYAERLTLMVRFSYNGSKAETPLKFIIKLPDSRQYEQTVYLTSRRGNYTYQFTIHHPEDFLGSGSVYLYYGFSIVDVLDFTIMPGA